MQVLLVYHYSIIGYRFGHHTSRSYHYIIANLHVPQNGYIATNPTIVANGNGTRYITLLVDGQRFVFVCMVMVVHFYVFTKLTIIAYGNTFHAIDGATIVKKNIVPNLYFATIATINKKIISSYHIVLYHKN